MIDRSDFIPESLRKRHAPSSFKLAPIPDRFLATGFDIAIFTPVIGFMLAPLFRKIELVSLSAPQSTEFSVLIGLAVCYTCVLAVLLQTLFLVWKKATPGQMFFKLQTLDIENPNVSLGLPQSLLRSFIWILEFFLLMLPFLEVFTDSQRRPLHDRAAGTIVVTKKKEFEQAPHPMEADVVRKVMAISFMVLAMWGMFGVSHLYKLAMSGDFKRSEMIAENYLCPEVTESLDADESKSDSVRIDKAIALYLADEVTEECVNSEADFALWSSENSLDVDSEWAYLAKGIVKKFDKDLAQAYFDKACQSEDVSTACELAKMQSALTLLPGAKVFENISESVSMTETAQVMMATDDFDQAKYAEAEKKFFEFKEKKGFSNYSQKGLVKSLWAQNKKAQAEGAFLSTVLKASNETKQEIAAWFCSEQLSDQCSAESKQSCEVLKARFEKDLRPIDSPIAAIALLKEKSCRQGSGLEMGRFHEIFEEYPDLLIFARALSDDISLSATERLDLLKDLSFRKSSVRPKSLRGQALQELAEKSFRKSDLDLISSYLDLKKLKDLGWAKVSEKMKAKNLSELKEGGSERAPASLGEQE